MGLAVLGCLHLVVSVGLAQQQRQPAVVLAVASENVEGIKLRLLVALARGQRREVGDAVAISTKF